MSETRSTETSHPSVAAFFFLLPFYTLYLLLLHKWDLGVDAPSLADNRGFILSSRTPPSPRMRCRQILTAGQQSDTAEKQATTAARVSPGSSACSQYDISSCAATKRLAAHQLLQRAFRTPLRGENWTSRGRCFAYSTWLRAFLPQHLVSFNFAVVLYALFRWVSCHASS